MKACLLSACVLIAAAYAPGASADWEPGQTNKMHYPQLPDLGSTGIDIEATTNFVLADDFRCTESGPITNIHIWGSWLGDLADPTPVFTLSLHADVPPGDGYPYSRPGETLWVRTFTPGLYADRIYASQIEEGWMTPPSAYVFPGDTVCHQYSFPVPAGAAFTQEVGTIYWLDVQVSTSNRFGWKTAVFPPHFNDDAVWALGREPGPFAWQPLVYPPQHSQHGQSIDLAFVIDGGTNDASEERPAPSLCLVWSQSIDTEAGLDVESARFKGAPPTSGLRVADDWMGDGRPIVAARWWGSYLHWQEGTPGAVSPPLSPRPLGFELTWWTDVPATGSLFSTPGLPLETNYVALLPFGTSSVGMVTETYACDTDLAEFGTNGFEHEFEYRVDLTNSSWRGIGKEGAVCWFSVEAIYPPPQAAPSNTWGWTTTHPLQNWNDDAARWQGTAWTELRHPLPEWQSLPHQPYAGESANMAFELLTDICPRRDAKWHQPPDMEFGVNMESYKVASDPAGAARPLRADDFVSDGRRITDVHWWGSYIGYMETVSNAVPPPSLPSERPLGFLLSWHTDIPAGSPIPSSRPGPAITNLFVPIVRCHEVYYGPVGQDWSGVPVETWEHEYQYYADLLDPDLGGPWYESNGVIYWLNVQAVFPAGWYPGDGSHRGWGWKTTPPANQWNDRSVVSTNWDQGQPAWKPAHYPLGHPFHPLDLPLDLAFELTTDQIRTNWPGGSPLSIRAIRIPGQASVGSVGDAGAGVQVLQGATNLAGSPAWVNLSTNPVPRPSPYTNWWTDRPATNVHFYRVRQQ